MRTDQELPSPDGAALAELAGWKLSYNGGRIALLTKGEEETLLRLNQ